MNPFPSISKRVALFFVWVSLSCGLPIVAQEIVFDASFDAAVTVDPTDVANLDVGSAVGSWSDLPAAANSLGVFDSGGDKGFLVDRATANFEINAQLAAPVEVGQGTEVSFAYAIRRSTGNHDKDITVTGYDLAGEVSFQVILTATTSGADMMRVAYMDPVSGYTNVPAGGAGDHGFLGSWNPAALAEIKLIFGSDGYVIEHDGFNGQWASSSLPYAGGATAIDRIGFSGRGGASGVAAGFWLDELRVSGEDAQLIESFTSNVNFVSPGEAIQLSWQLSGSPDSVMLDGVDVSGATSGGSGGVTQTVTETQVFELVATRGGHSESASVLVLADDLPLRITEVMSDNDNTLLAADGSSPDWIEITNFSDTNFDLAGWFLTDDPTDLSKWSFPATSMVPASGALIVFASGDPSTASELHASFKLGDADYLALVRADGFTIAQEFAPFLPLMHEDVSYGLGPDLTSLGFFERPSPGSANGTLAVETGPLLKNLTEDPPFSATGIPVSIEVDANGSPLTNVTLHFLIGYGVETQIPMAQAGSNLWSVTIPTSGVSAGEMLRWRVTASDALGRVTPFPSNVPAAASPRYHGTVAPDASITTGFPVLHWFVEDPDWYKNAGWDSDGRTSKSNNKNLTPVSLYFDGRFYDNAQMRLRGNSASNWEKPKFKVELNEGFEFQWSPDEEAVDEFNLQSHFVDQFPNAKASFIREYTYQALATEVEMPVFHMFYMQVRQNSGYFGLYSFTEQVDATFLRRNDLPDDGALYKATDGAALAVGDGTASHYRKATLKDEPFDDLVALIDQLNTSDSEQADFVFDHLDVPGIINKFAVDALTYNYDRVGHNYHVYHNPEKGEWTQLAWDLDLSFLINGRLLDPDFNHPLYLDGLDGRPFNGMAAAILKTEASREMYLRRLRTLMDQYLATTWMDGVLATLDSNIAAERGVDATAWPLVVVDVQEDLIDFYLPTRREQLYTTWGALLPDAEPANSLLSFGQIVANPVSGHQDEEFIEITNPNAWAVDISNWSLSGGVSYVFPAGSVILANSNCYVSPDVLSFRNRGTSPTGGEQQFVLGNYDGHLSNFGETVTLADEQGVVVEQITLPATPTDNQLHLVISEVMYNPQPDAEAEFIELFNRSDSLTLDLSGVQFTDGIDYTFPSGTQLAPGARIIVNKSDFTAGSLSNGGETIKLDDADGSTIFEFTYGDEAPWPETPDTTGTSLVFISGDPTKPANWRASTSVGGNPGSSDSLIYSGGDLLSYALAAEPVARLLGENFMLEVRVNLAADAVRVMAQFSSDLEAWSEPEAGLVPSQVVDHGDGTMTVSFTAPTSGADLMKQFGRLLVELR